MDYTPKVGDTVLYWPSEYDQAAMREQSKKALGYEAGNIRTAPLPATVVCVFGPTCINLRVHADGPACNDLWATSRQPMTAASLALGNVLLGSGQWEQKI